MTTIEELRRRIHAVYSDLTEGKAMTFEDKYQRGKASAYATVLFWIDEASAQTEDSDVA